MNDMEPAAILAQARQLMIDALQLLDGVQAWEPSAHLDLAIQRLDTMLRDTAALHGTH